MQICQHRACNVESMTSYALSQAESDPAGVEGRRRAAAAIFPHGL